MKAARIIPQAAPCYSCHQQHAAVDTTFVQFYPTLLAVAKDKGTLSKAYVSEMGGGSK
jgi:acyl carrier protein phosphodiesterase